MVFGMAVMPMPAVMAVAATAVMIRGLVLCAGCGSGG